MSTVAPAKTYTVTLNSEGGNDMLNGGASVVIPAQAGIQDGLMQAF